MYQEILNSEIAFNDIIEKCVIPHVKGLCDRFSKEGQSMMLDGVPCFTKKDNFISGTIISTMCYILTSCEKGSEEYKEWTIKVHDIIEKNKNADITTFGILEFLAGIYELQTKGILEEIVDEPTINTLKNNMKWEKFVDPVTLKLKGGLPTNYYGVAFRVALLREELGWDTENKSQVFLNVLLDHIKKYSGEFLFMDETDGGGRYDKYSITIASELCELLVLMDKEIPEILVELMKKAYDIVYHLADEHGYGFSYGRSIGSHATGALLENIPLAINMGIANDNKFMYSYAVYTGKHMMSFWYNQKREIFNIWDDGKKTDDYRGKHRVLEVNLDLSLKLIRCNKFLEKAGLNKSMPYGSADYKNKLAKIPKVKVFTFEQDTYSRKLFVYRGTKDVFMLPIISGAKKLYRTTPYLPIPSSTQFMMGSAEEQHPVMTPVVALTDGKKVMPICYADTIDYVIEDEILTVKVKQKTLCEVGGFEPEIYQQGRVTTEYTLSDDSISKKDTFTFDASANVKKVEMSFDTFSSEPKEVDGSVVFNKGPINRVVVNGLNIVEMTDIENNHEFFTPYGAQKTHIAYAKEIKDSTIEVETKYYI